jgi:hypothetical protein
MSAGHIGELALRRLRVGELAAAEAQAADAHARACPQCLARMRELDEEHARFHQELPFERFASGVERASRREKAPGKAPWLTPVVGMAAAALVVAAVSQPLIRGVRIKGGAGIALRIAGALGGPQRFASAEAPEPLAPGERVRIGYRPGTHRFVAAVSIDDGGQVTPLYPEFGTSLPADEGDATYYLPESVEFTGKGAETVVVVLSDQPLEVGDITRAVRRAFEESRGDVRHLADVKLPGDHFQRVFLKP